MRMATTGMAVARILSTGRRQPARRAAGRAWSPLFAIFSLLCVTQAAPALAGPPFFLVYAVPMGDGAVDPSSFAQDPSGMPEIDAVLIPEGASEFSIDVFFHNWSAAPVFAGACDNDVTGDDVCGWHQKLIANNGLQILSFLPATADIKHLLDPEMDSLSLTGGTPSTPQSGAVLIGTVTVRGSADNQTLNSGPGGAGGAQSVGFVSAALMSQVTRNFKIAETFNTCGDGTTVGQPHEECDDGNKDSGDGCYKNCQDESEGICTGTATANGSVSVPIESVTLTVPTVAGESAEQVVANIVDFANSADALISRGVTAEQIGTPGERFATDGSLGRIMSDTPGLPCPEPSQSLVLLTGISVLGLAGRRRFVA